MSKCDLIRDLLPLYVDGAASKESARAVEAHVATCYECRRALQDMRAPTPLPAPDEEDMSFAVSLGQLRKMRAKRRARYILLGIVVAAVLFALGMALFPPPVQSQMPPGGFVVMPPEDGAEALYAMSSVTLPLEAYEVSLVELKGEILTELELESDAVMAIFHVSEPVVWHSYSFSMTPALNGDYYDHIYFSALSRQPQETADEADSLYRYFITYQEGWQEMEIYKGSERDRQLLYQPGDTLPTACEELKQTLAEEDMFSAEMQAALAHQVALNRGEAQPTATP